MEGKHYITLDMDIAEKNMNNPFIIRKQWTESIVLYSASIRIMIRKINEASAS